MIVEAYNHSDLIKACKNVSPNQWQDIRSEIAAKMLEMPEARINTIENILAYMVRSAYYLSIDMIRKEKPIEVSEIQTEGSTDNSAIIEKITKDLDHPKRFYHARIFMYCITYKSVKAFSRKSGIPYNEVRETFIDYKKYIKEWSKSHI
jgi:hypothetical protein